MLLMATDTVMQNDPNDAFAKMTDRSEERRVGERV